LIKFKDLKKKRTEILNELLNEHGLYNNYDKDSEGSDNAPSDDNLDKTKAQRIFNNVNEISSLKGDENVNKNNINNKKDKLKKPPIYTNILETKKEARIFSNPGTPGN